MSDNLNAEQNSDRKPSNKTAPVFISYAHVDKEDAEAFCHELDRRGVPYWIDSRDLRPGRDWDDQVVEALDASKATILLLSNGSKESKYVKKEILLTSENGKNQFVVRLADVKPAKGLKLHASSAQWVDLFAPYLDPDKLDGLAKDLAEVIPPRIQRIFIPRYVRLVVAAIFACASVFWLNSLAEKNTEIGVNAQRFMSKATLYNQLVSANSYKLNKYVALVEVNPRTAPGVVDPEPEHLCKEREYYGALLGTLAALPTRPRSVVIDKYYGKTACEPGTKELLTGIRKLCAKNVPVVVERHATYEQGRGYILDEALDFSSNGVSCVREGMADLDPDFRRVRLFFDDINMKIRNGDLPGQDQPSLAFAAAVATKLKSADNVNYTEWTSQKWLFVCLREPDPGFLKTVINADTKIVCRENEHFKACEDLSEEQKFLLQPTANKVVVIGDNWKDWSKLPDYPDFDDEHITVAGPIPGYVLQANYIESLLSPPDVRRPTPEILNWLAGVGIFLGFDYFLMRHRPGRALACITLLTVGVVLAIYLAGQSLKYYFSPTPVAILAILYSLIIYCLDKAIGFASGLMSKG